MIGIRAEFAAKVSDVDVYDVCIAVLIGAPHLVENLVPADDGRMRPDQACQDRRFAWRERQLFGADPAPPGEWIEHELADLEHRRAWHVAASDQRPKSGGEDDEREGFGHEVVGSTVERFSEVVSPSFAVSIRTGVQSWASRSSRHTVNPFSDEPLRVADVKALVGDPANGEIIAVTGEQRRIRVDLDAKQVSSVHIGDHGLEPPDGTKTTGTITSIADTTTVTKGADGKETTTVEVEISPDGAFDALDGSPVTVTITTSTAAGVLAVPVETIVATADHRYALEVVDPGGTTHLAEVELGQSADGWVEITGAIAVGTTVVSA